MARIEAKNLAKPKEPTKAKAKALRKARTKVFFPTKAKVKATTQGKAKARVKERKVRTTSWTFELFLDLLVPPRFPPPFPLCRILISGQPPFGRTLVCKPYPLTPYKNLLYYSLRT